MEASQSITARIIPKKWKNERLDISFLAVAGLLSETAQEKINLEIDRALKLFLFEQNYYTDPLVSITGDYRITLNEKSILSIYFQHTAYAKYAAYPLNKAIALVFDLAGGDRWHFGDLFKQGSDYITKTSDIVLKQSIDNGYNLYGFKHVDYDQQYYLTEKDLVIFYPEQRYTAHALGIIEFSIPYGIIQEYINPNGPIALLL